MEPTRAEADVRSFLADLTGRGLGSAAWNLRRQSAEGRAGAVRTTAPGTMREDERLVRGLEVMGKPQRKVDAGRVTDEEGRLQGVVRMNDVLGSGVRCQAGKEP